MEANTCIKEEYAMKIAENVHLIRKDFLVTPEVKRYINIYLITGENCYLIDSGIAGSEKIIEKYLHFIGRNISDIKEIFLTHSQPDHIGGAADIQKNSNCKVYAPMPEVEWIQDIDLQYRERPIPNFYKLLAKSVNVDVPLKDGFMNIWELKHIKGPNGMRREIHILFCI